MISAINMSPERSSNAHISIDYFDQRFKLYAKQVTIKKIVKTFLCFLFLSCVSGFFHGLIDWLLY